MKLDNPSENNRLVVFQIIRIKYFKHHDTNKLPFFDLQFTVPYLIEKKAKKKSPMSCCKYK